MKRPLDRTTIDPPKEDRTQVEAIKLGAGLRVEQYELIRELGKGGMGQVFLARDTKLGRRVAIKFLAAKSKKFTERFLVEARATARCSHENIVVIHEVDEYLGMPYMVLEYVEGATLHTVIREKRMPAGRFGGFEYAGIVEEDRTPQKRQHAERQCDKKNTEPRAARRQIESAGSCHLTTLNN